MKRFLKLWFEKVLPKLIKAWLFSKRIITEAKVLSRDYAKGFWKKLSPHRALIVIALIAGIIGGIISWAILPKPEIQFEIMEIETIETGEVKIEGPGNEIFSFETDGYWYPERTVEKWIEVKNVGTLPFDFYIISSGQDFPSFDAKGDGANLPLRVSWPAWDDVDNDDHGVWHIKPGSSQGMLIRVYLPYEADNTCQGDIWTLTFIFQAVQCSELD